MQKWRGLTYFFVPLIMTIGLSVESSPAQEPDKSRTDDRTQVSTVDPGITSSRLTGYVVDNQFGEKLGSVKNLIIDMRSGWLDFVIISTGGFLGLGWRLRAVPPTALSPATAFYRTLAMNVRMDHWKTAPTFSKRQMAFLGNPEQVRRIYQYYGIKWPPVESLAEAKLSSPSTDREDMAARNPELAGDLIQRSVVTARDQEVGRIVDLLVNLKSPNITFVILKPGPFITSSEPSTKDQLFAVPVYALANGRQYKKLILETNAQEFRQARPLVADDWRNVTPGSGSPRIFRYQANDRIGTQSVVLRQMSCRQDINNKLQNTKSSWKS